MSTPRIPQIKVHIQGNYQENKETTFNYVNRESGEKAEHLSKAEVVKLAKRDIQQGLLVSYPAAEIDLDLFI